MPTYSATFTHSGEVLSGIVVTTQKDPQVSYVDAIFQADKGGEHPLISHLKFFPPGAIIKELQTIESLSLGEEISPLPVLRE